MKQRGQCKRYDTDHLLDTLDSKLLDLEGDLVAVGCEEVREIQDFLRESGGEEDNLGGLGHLLLDALALITHALQICAIFVLASYLTCRVGFQSHQACCLPRQE